MLEPLMEMDVSIDKKPDHDFSPVIICLLKKFLRLRAIRMDGM